MTKRDYVVWSEDPSADLGVVWNKANLVENLVAVLHRRSIEAIQKDERTNQGALVFPGESKVSASLGDIATFLRGEMDDERINRLVRGLVLLNWARVIENDEEALGLSSGPSEPRPDAIYALLKLCHSPHPVRDVHVPLEPSIARMLGAGRLDDATKLSSRRLLGSSLPPAIRVAALGGAQARRLSAALLFPLRADVTQTLAKMVLKPHSEV